MYRNCLRPSLPARYTVVCVTFAFAIVRASAGTAPFVYDTLICGPRRRLLAVRLYGERFEPVTDSKAGCSRQALSLSLLSRYSFRRLRSATSKVPPAGARSGPLVHRLRYPRGEFRWFTTTAAPDLRGRHSANFLGGSAAWVMQVATFRAASPAGGDTIAPTAEPEPSG